MSAVRLAFVFLLTGLVVLAQAAPTGDLTASTGISDPLSFPLFDQGVITAVGVWVIQRAKAWTHMKFINDESTAVNRIVGIVMAAGIAGGIHATWDSGPGTLVITGLTATGIGHFLWEFARQFVMQQVVYHKFFDTSAAAPPPPPKITEATA